MGPEAERRSLGIAAEFSQAGGATVGSGVLSTMTSGRRIFSAPMSRAGSLALSAGWYLGVAGLCWGPGPCCSCPRLQGSLSKELAPPGHLL